MQYYLLGIAIGIVLLNVLYINITVGGAEVSEKELKQVLAGITIVTTMLKLVIQHRGQVQKGKKDV